MDRRKILIDGESPGFLHGFFNDDGVKVKINIRMNEHDFKRVADLYFSNGIYPAFCDVIVHSQLYAIVEKLDGTIQLVRPVDRIRFTDIEK